MVITSATRLFPGSRRAHTILYAAGALTLFFFTLSQLRAQPPWPSTLLNETNGQKSDEGDANLKNQTLDLPLPAEYTYVKDFPPECADRYQRNYLENFRSSAVNYCSNTSFAQLDCFHSSTAPDRVDTLCYGSGATFNVEKHKFELPCSFRPLSPDEKEHGIPTFSHLHNYWYDTGPTHVFDKAVAIQDPQTTPVVPKQRPLSVLVKREGGSNTWHSLMEIFSLTMTLDVLRSTVNRATGKAFLSDADRENIQVVIVDDSDDGPYFDLWRIFAQKPTLRLGDLNETSFGDIIVPLVGGASPLWQGDWEVKQCDDSELLRVFATRVMDFCGTQTSSKDGDIRVTWVNRTGTRRLVEQERLLEAARTKIPHVEIQSVDFAGMPFCEQVRTIRSTDVLAGVHGAAFTHGIWLQPDSAMAEIMPEPLNFKGFRNLATLLGLDYFSVRGKKPSSQRKRGENWQGEDVEIDEEKFVKLVESAVRSTYKKGLRDFDVM